MKTKTQQGKAKKGRQSSEAAADSGSQTPRGGSAGVGKAVAQKGSNLPAKKAGEKKATADSAVKGLFSKSMQFLREAKMELKKVKWPTRKELMASTAVVIVLSLLVAFYLGLVDFGLIKIIRLVVG